jgi:hypothetical protein
MTRVNMAAWTATALLAMADSAQDMERHLEELLPKDWEERHDALMAKLKGGDMKVFSVVTDRDIVGLGVRDIYSNNASFFRVVAVSAEARKAGKKGGAFRVERIGGTNDPMRTWNRLSGSGPIRVESLISSEQAVALARQACQGVAEVPAKIEGIVTETNGHYVVTFLQSHPERTEGGSFYARVKVEKATGRIIDGIEVSE